MKEWHQSQNQQPQPLRRPTCMVFPYLLSLFQYLKKRVRGEGESESSGQVEREGERTGEVQVK